MPVTVFSNLLDFTFNYSTNKDLAKRHRLVTHQAMIPCALPSNLSLAFNTYVERICKLCVLCSFHSIANFGIKFIRSFKS